MAKLLSLFHYKQKQQKFHPYLLFESQLQSALECLSPDLMQLTDNVYVADLTVVKSYWLKQAEQQQRHHEELLTQVLLTEITDCELSLFCEHPFQGLVLYNHLKQQGSQGHYQSSALFTEKIYENMNWEPWLWSARQLHDCFELNSCFSKERQNFSTQLKRLQTFTERVDLQKFNDLKQAHFFELQRRFKGFIGKLWQWTFPQIDEQQEVPANLFNYQHYQQLKGFPWTAFRPKQKPQLKQWLEYPVSDWQALIEPLIFDLEKLSRMQELQPPTKVLQLSWTLTLFDLSQVEHSMLLHQPLSLMEERQADFPVLRKQLLKAFESFQKDQKQQAKELDYINIPLVVGWRLQVEKTIALSQRSYSLDPDDNYQKLRQEELQQLSDKVKTPLQAYQLKESFIPGFDFDKKQTVAETQLSLVLLNLPRPFYLTPEQSQLDPKQIKHSQFLDRTSADWWNLQDPLNSYRDCFLCELDSQEFVFAYRDYLGQWFQYGV